MADSGQQRLDSRAPQDPRRLALPRRIARQIGSLGAGGSVAALFLTAALAWILLSWQVTLPLAVLTAALAIAVVLMWAPLRRPLPASVLLLNVGLVLLYFWSLGETYHLTVEVAPGQLTARINEDTATVPIRSLPRDTRFGLQQPAYASYRMQATGEPGQADTSSVLGRVAEAFRLAQPGPAWKDVRLSLPGGRTHALEQPRTETPSGSWSKNSRGEWQAAPGAFLLSAPIHADRYRIDADLVRPDGGQTLLVAVDSAGTGYALQVRFDQPDFLWASWRNGAVGSIKTIAGLGHTPPLGSAQRDIRLLLTGYLFALIFAALAIGLYPALLLFFHNLGSPIGAEWAAAPSTPRTEAPWVSLDRPAFRWAFFAATTAAGIVATGLVATVLLDRIPHVQDDVGYLFQARIFALGRFNVPAPPAAIHTFFEEEYIPFYQGRWFSQYPPGHPLMLTLGVLAHAAWLTEPILASLSIGLVYLLGLRLYGQGVAVLAAVLGLLSPFWLFLGSSMMSHPTGMFFGVACMLCAVLAEQRDEPVWPFLAGLAGGMAFATRQLTALGLLGPFALYALAFGRRPLRGYLPAVAGLALPTAFFLIYNWVQMGDPLTSTYIAWDSSDKPGFTPASPGGPFTFGDGLWNAYQNLAMLAVHLYGWPYAVAFAFALLPFVLGAARRWDALLLASFLGVVVAYVFYWCSCLMYGPRFYYEALPALLLLTARGLWELGRLPLRVWRRILPAHDPALAVFFPGILLAALTLYNLRFYLPAQIPLYQNYNYSSDAELRTVQRAHIHHAIVFVVTNPIWEWWPYGNVFFANDPRLRGDIIYARDRGARDPLLYRYFPNRKHYRLDGTHLTPMN